jgi:hypothetical protein
MPNIFSSFIRWTMGSLNKIRKKFDGISGCSEEEINVLHQTEKKDGTEFRLLNDKELKELNQNELDKLKTYIEPVEPANPSSSNLGSKSDASQEPLQKEPEQLKPEKSKTPSLETLFKQLNLNLSNKDRDNLRKADQKIQAIKRDKKLDLTKRENNYKKIIKYYKKLEEEEKNFKKFLGDIIKKYNLEKYVKSTGTQLFSLNATTFFDNSLKVVTKQEEGKGEGEVQKTEEEERIDRLNKKEQKLLLMKEDFQRIEQEKKKYIIKSFTEEEQTTYLPMCSNIFRMINIERSNIILEKDEFYTNIKKAQKLLEEMPSQTITAQKKKGKQDELNDIKTKCMFFLTKTTATDGDRTKVYVDKSQSAEWRDLETRFLNVVNSIKFRYRLKNRIDNKIITATQMLKQTTAEQTYLEYLIKEENRKKNPKKITQDIIR